MSRPIFLAAPEQGEGALGVIDKLILQLQVVTGGALKGSLIFVPHLQIGDVGIETDAATYFSKSLEALGEAQVVVAVLDGPQVDDDVAFWMGYAFAAGKPIIGYVTDRRAKRPLPDGACAEVVGDVHALQAALARILVGQPKA